MVRVGSRAAAFLGVPRKHYLPLGTSSGALRNSICPGEAGRADGSVLGHIHLLDCLHVIWFIAGLAVALGLISLRREGARASYVRECLAQPDPVAMPAASVIVPVEGPDEGLRENLAALAALDYPGYELIVVVREAKDLPPDVLPARARLVFAGDGDPSNGEKVNNLLAAVMRARPESEIFAFADSDGCVQKGWLRALLLALEGEGVGAATGFRWYVPLQPTFWNLLRSAWNAAAAGTLGPGPNRIVWGGAMAIRRSTFEAARLTEYWRGTVSDDYGLGDAMRAAGLSIAWAPGATVACTDGTGGLEFLRWIARQMIITRVYAPRLWWAALIAHLIYCGAMAACVWAIAQGRWLALVPLAAQLGLGMWKGAARARSAPLCLPQYTDWFRRSGWIYTWGVHLATWIWLYSLLISARTTQIQWRGRTYQLKRREIINVQ